MKFNILEFNFSEKLSPYCLVHPNCMDDLTNKTPSETEVYDAVILGDAVDGFCYKNLNKAFQTIMKTGCDFYCLGLGRFYREGKYVRAVEVQLGYSIVSTFIL